MNETAKEGLKPSVIEGRELLPPGSKHCRFCFQTKPLKHFKTTNQIKSGYTSACRKCYLSRQKQYYYDNREKRLAYQTKYNRSLDPKVVSAYGRAYYKNNKAAMLETERRNRLKSMREEINYLKIRVHDQKKEIWSLEKSCKEKDIILFRLSLQEALRER